MIKRLICKLFGHDHVVIEYNGCEHRKPRNVTLRCNRCGDIKVEEFLCDRCIDNEMDNYRPQGILYREIF